MIEPLYYVEVLVDVSENPPRREWRKVHATGAEPYQFTKKMAEQYVRVYGLDSKETRHRIKPV